MRLQAWPIALALLAVACADRPAPRGGTLVLGIRADLDAWNPYTTREATAASLLDLVYPRLVHETADPERPFEPWLARAWTISQDRRTVTFALREEARWSDGRPVGCDDVRFTFAVQTDPQLDWPGRAYKERIAGIDCPDPHTAVVRFTQTVADPILDANDNAILPRAYESIPVSAWRETPWETRLISCGPFRLEALRAGQEAILARDPTFWDADEVVPDRLVLRVFPDEAGALLALGEGAVDVLHKVPPLQAATLGSRAGLRVLRVPSRTWTFIAWNTLEPGAYAADRRARRCGDAENCRETPEILDRLRADHRHPILSDVRVRRALALAIDREDLIRGLWSGFARPVDSPIVAGLPGHRDDLRTPYDPGAAARALDEAGWRDTDGDGVRDRDGVALALRVAVYAGNTTRVDALERIAAALAPLGVRIQPERLGRAEFVAGAWNRDFDGVLSAWRAGSRVEPELLFHSAAALDRGNNLGAWSTAESDRLLDRAARSTDRGEAARLWGEWQALFHEQAPYAMLYEEETLLGLGPRVLSATPTALDPYHDLHRWPLAPEPDRPGR